jgi:hypothetical protein
MRPMAALVWLVGGVGVGALLGRVLRADALAGAILGVWGPPGWLFVLLIPDKRAGAVQRALTNRRVLLIFGLNGLFILLLAAWATWWID